jgi:ribosomal protein L7/L12
MQESEIIKLEDLSTSMSQQIRCAADLECGDSVQTDLLATLQQAWSQVTYLLQKGLAELAANALSAFTPEEMEFIHKGMKIQAIKAVRERKGMALKDAKEYVEAGMEAHAAMQTPAVAERGPTRNRGNGR